MFDVVVDTLADPRPSPLPFSFLAPRVVVDAGAGGGLSHLFLSDGPCDYDLDYEMTCCVGETERRSPLLIDGRYYDYDSGDDCDYDSGDDEDGLAFLL